MMLRSITGKNVLYAGSLQMVQLRQYRMEMMKSGRIFAILHATAAKNGQKASERLGWMDGISAS